MPHLMLVIETELSLEELILSAINEELEYSNAEIQ